ncbi:MAG: sensor histidine kinase [Betaproteobacteria bacterium]
MRSGLQVLQMAKPGSDAAREAQAMMERHIAHLVRLLADPVRLAQVVANLLNNAAKYTPEGGRISLSVRRVKGHAVIDVRDNGIGIAPEMLPRVFEKFAQLPGALKRSHGGLGIGLSLARTLVELHGGSIEARSAGEGKGAQFVVSLPALAAPPPGETAP